jgi:hypothetical protein
MIGSDSLTATGSSGSGPSTVTVFWEAEQPIRKAAVAIAIIMKLLCILTSCPTMIVASIWTETIVEPLIGRPTPVKPYGQQNRSAMRSSDRILPAIGAPEKPIVY